MDDPSPDRPQPYLRMHAVDVYVRNQERSLRFYLDQLGFQLALDVRIQSGGRLIAVSPPDGSSVLSLVEARPDSPAYKLIGRNTHVTFMTEDVAGKYREWRSRGVRFRHTPRLRRMKFETNPLARPSLLRGERTPIWGLVSTRFEDLDRNTFALVSFDEFSASLEAQRRALAEKLEAERRAAQELEIATRVQARLFPQTLPPLASLEYAGLCVQARQVGGDYYDFLELGRGRLGLVIGDIAGKGIAAALLMANLQANLRSQCAIALEEPERFLCSVNRLFFQNTEEHAYATLFFAEYDDQTGVLRYANCGHLAALLLRSDNTLDRLSSTATVLGMFEEWECATGERRLFAGDTLMLYTDGITESFNDAGEEFGERRLVEALRRARHRPSSELLSHIVEQVREFSPREQSDDITLIVARCTSVHRSNSCSNS
jgi:serine phosphatase RsbU (regulator of sigma subunit)